MIQVIFIAISLAMDAFAVSISQGVCIKQFKKYIPLIFGLTFGIFQFSMTTIGYFGGKTFLYGISKYDNIISCAILVLIGILMILEAIKNNKDECEVDEYRIEFKKLINLGIATSIDALAIGISFSFSKINIFVSALIIGLAAFLFSYVGIIIGYEFGLKFSKFSEYLGGIILIVLGIEALF